MNQKLIISVSSIAIAYILIKLIGYILYKTIVNIEKYHRLNKIVSTTIVLVETIFLGALWISSSQELSTFLGLASAGIAIALKDPLTDIAGWIFIAIRKPYMIGHRIEIAGIKGDVIDIRLFQTILMEVGNWVEAEQSTGRLIHLPNSTIFSHSLANFNKGFPFIWNEIPVLLTFESNRKDAYDKLTEIAETHSHVLSPEASDALKKANKKLMIFYPKLTPIVYTSVKENGVQLTIRYLCKPKHRRSSSEKIWLDILDFIESRDDIDFAYTTYRIIDKK